MRHINGIADLKTLVGQHVGQSDWVTIDQTSIDAFANNTHDHNWIHVDPHRAASTSFGATIAHGYHSLSLIGGLIQDIFIIDGVRMGLNYGIDKARFPQAVPVDSKVRLSVELTGVVDAGVDAADAHYHCVIEVDRFAKPACVADIVFRYYAK